MQKTVTVQSEPGEYLLNMYGDKDKYHPYAGVGDVVREDGVLIAFRKKDHPKHHIDDELHADNLSDRIVYTEPHSVVKDLIVSDDYKMLTFVLETPDTMTV